MKRLFKCGTVVGLVALFFSCSKELSYEGGAPGGDSTASGDFRATINNVLWVASPKYRRSKHPCGNH